jgi:hypothetical protein
MVVEGELLDATTPLPTGTVTFLFTDIERSTRFYAQHPGRMLALFGRSRSLGTLTVGTYKILTIRFALIRTACSRQ